MKGQPSCQIYPDSIGFWVRVGLNADSFAHFALAISHDSLLPLLLLLGKRNFSELLAGCGGFFYFIY